MPEKKESNNFRAKLSHIICRRLQCKFLENQNEFEKVCVHLEVACPLQKLLRKFRQSDS